jgi:hypothetical protein
MMEDVMSSNAIDITAVGDFNNNGEPDFVWVRQRDNLMVMWEYDPTAQTVGTTILGDATDWVTFGSAHFSNANGSNASASQMLMAGPNSIMTLWWVGNGALTGVLINDPNNPPPLWQNVNYIAAGQFTNNGGPNITNFLVSNVTDNHLYDWWIGSNNTLQGVDLTATSNVSWAGIDFVATGQFVNNGVTNFLVSNSTDQHLYDWWITPQNQLTGVDLTATSGASWLDRGLVAIGNFDGNAPNGNAEWLVRNTPDNHLYEWWIDSTNTLQGIDLTATSNIPWAGVELIAVGRFDNNSTGAEMVVRNVNDQHLYEWWLTPQGGLSEVDLTQNSGIGGDVQILGSSHYNNSSALDQLLVWDTNNGNFYQWWTVGSGATTKVTGVVLGATGSATSSDSTSLLAQSMASFGASGAAADPAGAPAAIGPWQQPTLATAIEQHSARA